jgi:hypothetical protein
MMSPTGASFPGVGATYEDSGKRNRAVELSERIGREDGAGKASEQIETALAERGR